MPKKCNEDSHKFKYNIAKQALQWTAQGHRGRGRPRTHGGGSSRMKCGWRVSGTAGGRWRRQRRTEMDGDEVSVAYAPPGVTRQEKKTKCCASIMFYRKVNYKLLI